MTEQDGTRGLRRAGVWAGVIAAILAIPLVAMQFSEEVQWTAFDFVFAGGLMGAVATVYELAARRGAPFYRAGVGAALAAAFLLIWMSGAVGVIGSEDDAANFLFLGVLATGFLGTLLARFRPVGMAWTFAATALAQAAVGIAAVTAGWGADGPKWPWDIVVLTSVFTALWLMAAALFREAAARRTI